MLPVETIHSDLMFRFISGTDENIISSFAHALEKVFPVAFVWRSTESPLELTVDLHQSVVGSEAILLNQGMNASPAIVAAMPYLDRATRLDLLRTRNDLDSLCAESYRWEGQGFKMQGSAFLPNERLHKILLECGERLAEKTAED